MFAQLRMVLWAWHHPLSTNPTPSSPSSLVPFVHQLEALGNRFYTSISDGRSGGLDTRYREPILFVKKYFFDDVDSTKLTIQMVVCACVVRALAEQRAELTSNTFGWWMFKTAPGSICSGWKIGVIIFWMSRKCEKNRCMNLCSFRVSVNFHGKTQVSWSFFFFAGTSIMICAEKASLVLQN